VVIFDDKAYAGGKSIDNAGGKLLDFLLQNAISRNAVIVEIKEPTTDLLGGVYRSPNIYSPSKELSGAVMQISKYKYTLLTHFHSLKNLSGFDGSAVNPKCVVIIGNAQTEFGNSNDVTKMHEREALDLFRNGLRDVEIVTFDELFLKIKTLIDLLEGKSVTPDN
jgi:hypothetical protein